MKIYTLNKTMERKYNNCSVAYWGEPDIHLKF